MTFNHMVKLVTNVDDAFEAGEGKGVNVQG
jgi:hypothetical protein